MRTHSALRHAVRLWVSLTLLGGGLVASCTKPDTVLLVNVADDSGTLTGVTQLKVRVLIGEAVSQFNVPTTAAGPISFPTTFTVEIARSNSGAVNVTVSAMAGGKSATGAASLDAISIGSENVVTVHLGVSSPPDGGSDSGGTDGGVDAGTDAPGDTGSTDVSVDLPSDMSSDMGGDTSGAGGMSGGDSGTGGMGMGGAGMGGMGMGGSGMGGSGMGGSGMGGSGLGGSGMGGSGLGGSGMGGSGMGGDTGTAGDSGTDAGDASDGNDGNDADPDAPVDA